MKAKIHLIVLLQLAVFACYSQRGMGVAYYTRIFPFQQYKNEQSDYLREENSYDDNVSVLDGIENNIQFYYQLPRKAGQFTNFRFGVNYSSTTLDFERSFTKRWPLFDGGDPHAPPPTYYYYTRKGRYDYKFAGLSFSLLRNRVLNEKLAFTGGISTSFHYLVYSRLSNKEEKIEQTSTTTDQNGNPVTTSSVTTTDNVADPDQEKFNFKIEFPLYLQYNFTSSCFHFGLSAGISTQSKILVNDVGLNFYIAPTFSYTRFFGN